MTQEQIMELLNRKIQEVIETYKQYCDKYNTERWRDYYHGVLKGLKDARNIVEMLDK